MIKDLIHKHRQKNCIKHFRDNDPVKISKKSQTSTKKELKCINCKIIKKIPNCSQQHRNFNVIIIVNTKSITAEKAGIHIDQCIKSEKRSIEQIYQQATEKACPQTTFTPSHQSHGHTQDQKKIGRNRAYRYQMDHCGLHQETDNYGKKENNLAFHCSAPSS